MENHQQTVTNANQLYFPKAHEVDIRAISISDPNAHEVQIETLYSGISKGTESLVFGGLVPKCQQTKMKCPNQIGEFTFPVAYGYSTVGKIVKLGNKVSDLSIGEHVFCMHPHQSHFNINEHQCTKIPNHVDTKRAVLTPNLETALNAFWDANISGQKEVAVIGAGAVGLLTAYTVSKLSKANVVVVDINPKKREIASALNLPFLDATKDKLGKYHTIFHTSARQSGLQTAIDHCSFEGTVVEMSWYGNHPVSINLGGAFHSRRLKIISSQVSHVAPKMRASTNNAQRLAKVIEMLVDKKLDVLLKETFSLDNSQKLYSSIVDHSSDTLCAVIDYKKNNNKEHI